MEIEIIENEVPRASMELIRALNLRGPNVFIRSVGLSCLSYRDWFLVSVKKFKHLEVFVYRWDRSCRKSLSENESRWILQFDDLIGGNKMLDGELSIRVTPRRLVVVMPNRHYFRFHGCEELIERVKRLMLEL